VVVHGRRRAGKSAPLTLGDRKPIAYYVAAQQLERTQLDDLGGPRADGNRAPAGPSAKAGAQGLGRLVVTVAAATEQRRVGLILDEFPYLVDANPALPRYPTVVGHRGSRRPRSC
jgi:hypothetical protein